MSRSGSPTDFSGDSIELFFAVNFQMDDETVGFWTGYGDITVDSIVYTGAGEMLSFSEISEDNEISANGVTVILAGLDSTAKDLALDQEYQYRKAEINLGSLNNYSTIQSYKLFV